MHEKPSFGLVVIGFGRSEQLSKRIAHDIADVVMMKKGSWL